MAYGQRYVSEAISLELALTVSSSANEEPGQRRVFKKSVDQEDFESYGYT